jgi:hypothetical protein
VIDLVDFGDIFFTTARHGIRSYVSDGEPQTIAEGFLLSVA